MSALLTSPNRIDRVLRRSEDGSLYSTDAEYYLGNDGPHSGGPNIRVPQWHGYHPSEEDLEDLEDLEAEAAALIEQLDSQELPTVDS